MAHVSENNERYKLLIYILLRLVLAYIYNEKFRFRTAYRGIAERQTVVRLHAQANTK
jgi:hypothetical protein